VLGAGVHDCGILASVLSDAEKAGSARDRDRPKSERLNRFIANLLDMTKLGNPAAIVANTALHECVGEIVGSVLAAAPARFI